MAKTFPDPRGAAFSLTGALEGGFKPSGVQGDPNQAFHGVNQSTYDAERDRRGLPRQDVRQMSSEEQYAIYGQYWAAWSCGAIAAKSGALAICHFDCGFNGGAAEVLERTEGETGPVHPVTPEEVETFIGLLATGEDAVCAAYLQNRLDRFRGLKIWPQAGHDWTIRLTDLARFVEISWRPS